MSNIITDKNRIEEIFSRGTVVEVLPSREAFIEKLMSGQRLRMYIGFDPTATSLHVGHAKNIMFMEELRQLGHEIIILFGDFTARIGDPDKNSTRKQLTEEDVKHNVSGWMQQVAPLIDFQDPVNPAKIMYNSVWLSKLNFSDIISIASNFTVQQMIERDLFAKRLAANAPIHLHEFMYPLMQGYDSVAMDVDVEVCGNDQIFNALAGRTLMKRMKDKDKIVVALNLVANPATGELMSKSNGTGVFVNLPPNELFGALMALPDPMIEPLFTNCTRIPLAEKESIMSLGPRLAKASIAYDIVKRFYGEQSAENAENNFEATFAKGGLPENIQEIHLPSSGKVVLADLLIQANIVPSKTEWRRLIENGAVRTEDDTKISDPNFLPLKTMVLKIGKRRFVKLVKGN
jgi:tyrosyl-tRNA synthetase